MAAAAFDASETRTGTSCEPDSPQPHQLALNAIKQHVFHEPQGHSAWQRMPELPAASEILVRQAEAEPLPHNRIGGDWTSKNEYLETHYRLLRREGTEALRYAVNKYKSNLAPNDDEDLCIYTKVRILGYLMTRLGPLCRISFSTDHAQKKILWQQSRRLIPGTVLAISTKRDNFETLCMTATVAQRPYRDGLDQNPPQIEIVWGSTSEYVVDPDMELIMIEARSGYFEAVRHTLVGLQMAAKSESPLFKYVVQGDQSDALASFVRDKPARDLSSCLSKTASRDTVEWLRAYDVREPMPDIRDQTPLDATQFHALYRMITKELCIVQGPPGTGKTFTSVEALRVILANQKGTDPPVIVAAQTNHALDQLLTLCLDAGARILRVGGRTESERIGEHTMYKARQKFHSGVEQIFRALDARRRTACTALADLTATIFHDKLLQPEDLLTAGVISREQYDSLIDDEMEQTELHRPHGAFSLWLAGECIESQVLHNKHCDRTLGGDDEEYNREEYEFEEDFENIADDDEDRDRIHGTFIPFSYKWTGREPAHLSAWHKRAAREISKPDLYTVPKSMRGAVYQLLFERYVEKLRPELVKCFAEYIQCCKEVKAYRWLRDLNVVKQLHVNIIGCTTTGLTKYRGFLAALGAKTMLIEEAAETRECNITSALYPSVQQLILVGDHLQLTPSSNIRWLRQEPYYLDMSLFERMIEHTRLPYIMLDKQRRMAPEIRAVMDHFYDGLVDHPVVLKRESVPGMGDRRTWLFAHKWEDAVDHNHSRFNSEEATMIVGFFAYLMSNGVKQSQITVLTFYKAQRRMILKKLKMHPSLAASAEPYQVHTVDSYQGEENDIVLLSLVRSPAADKGYTVGFLSNKNRVVVAISRARLGFYMFGNIVNASKASAASGEIWNPIWRAFIEQKRYDPARGLPLQCQPHGRTIWIKDAIGWADNTGGCDKRCSFVRECGHMCTFPCHVKSHDMIRCGLVCGKTLACGHVCQIWCKDPCNCLCTAFQAIKKQNEIRRLQDHQQMHMDLEELLQAEAALDQPSEVNLPKTVDRPMEHAKQRPTPTYATVVRGEGVANPQRQEPRKPGPPRGDRQRKPGKTKELAHASSKPTGPIVRPPSQRRQLRVAEPGTTAHRYRDFVQSIDIHDRANMEAWRASLAETAGREPQILDNYRPVRLVDGRRVETPSNSSPEKEGKQLQDGHALSSEVLIPAMSELATALLPRRLTNANAARFTENTPYKKRGQKGLVMASPGSGHALSANALSANDETVNEAHSEPTWIRERAAGQRNGLPMSGAYTSGNSHDFPEQVQSTHATSVDLNDGDASGTGAEPVLDLASLTKSPSASRLGAVQEEYPDLAHWLETLPIHGNIMLSQKQPGVPHSGAAPSVEASGANDEDDQGSDDLLIRF